MQLILKNAPAKNRSIGSRGSECEQNPVLFEAVGRNRVLWAVFSLAEALD